MTVTSQAANKKRIAKNTLMLYIRMAVMAVVTLYTSRVVLAALGVTDYGIYNIVGGVVILFAFINNAMSTATQRFLNFELGRDDISQAARVFSMSMTVHIGIALILVLLGETVGLWLLEHRLVIPPERMNAARWAFQISMLAAVVKIMLVPYNATIIAHERMTFYAYVSLAEALLGLTTAFAISRAPGDQLIFYSLLVLVSGVTIFFIYQFHCRKSFALARYHPVWDKRLFLQLFSFSGWSLLGNGANSLASQGVNILFNMFLGVGTNAAMAIANQVNTAAGTFVASFQTAFNPHIVKSYASGDTEHLFRFVAQTAKFSFFLLFVIVLPLLINTDFLLHFWLGKAPEQAVAFSRILLFCALVNTLNGPLLVTAQAIGDIRNYQIMTGAVTFLSLPLSYLSLRFGATPSLTLAIIIILSSINTYVRLAYLRKKIQFPSLEFARHSIGRCGLVAIISLPLAVWFGTCSTPGWTTLVISSVSCTALGGFAIYYLGLTDSERATVNRMVLSRLMPRAEVRNAT